MARFTRSDCFDQPPSRLAALLTSTALAAAQALAPLSAAAEPRWRYGVFPVASFSGYTSHFGSRIGPQGRREPHYGLDIAAPLGSPIHNWWGGVVQELVLDGACGVGLVIRSGPYDHVYCHLAGSVQAGRYRSGAVQLVRGQRVRAGELIGHVGLSGRTSGPHLHWGVRYRGRWLNPAAVLQAMAAARQRGRSRITAPNSQARP